MCKNQPDGNVSRELMLLSLLLNTSEVSDTSLAEELATELVSN